MALRALLRAVVRSPKRNQPQEAAPESEDIATAPQVQKEIDKPDGWAEVYPPGWSGTPLNDAPNWSGRAAGGFYCINKHCRIHPFYPKWHPAGSDAVPYRDWKFKGKLFNGARCDMQHSCMRCFQKLQLQHAPEQRVASASVDPDWNDNFIAEASAAADEWQRRHSSYASSVEGQPLAASFSRLAENQEVSHPAFSACSAH
jgi:hypothetical protein